MKCSATNSIFLSCLHKPIPLEGFTEVTLELENESVLIGKGPLLHSEAIMWFWSSIKGKGERKTKTTVEKMS